MSPVLKDKVAIITGASRGLGKAFALRFAEEGAKLLITTTNPKRAEGTLKEIRAKGAEVAVVEADIAKESDTRKIADEAVKKYGTVDILVNNAAIWGGLNMTPWDGWTTEDWDRILTVNVRGTWLVCKAVVPIMVKAGKGKIINVASNIAKVPAAHLFLPYSCSKGAVYTLTQALAHALGPSGINVNAVAPGYTASEASLGQVNSDQIFEIATGEQSMHQRLEPANMVGAVVFLASSDADLISGQTYYIDGGTVML
jgi:NAD(P)-dependent dehydrogenase (short-subunit alcohol dehydrogenase family)